MINFGNFFKEGTPESMTRLMSFILIASVALMVVAAIVLAIMEKLDLVFVGLILSVAGAALTGKVQGARVEKNNKTNG